MPLTIAYNDQSAFLRVTVTGAWPTAMEQAQVRARLVDHGVLTENTCVLIDLRAVAEAPTPDDIQSAIATAVAQDTALVRRALLVTPQQYGATSALAELDDYEGAPIKLFKDESAAVRWLTGHQQTAAAAASRRSPPTESL
jgi:hypothetical protein